MILGIWDLFLFFQLGQRAQAGNIPGWWGFLGQALVPSQDRPSLYSECNSAFEGECYEFICSAYEQYAR